MKVLDEKGNSGNRKEAQFVNAILENTQHLVNGDAIFCVIHEE